MRFEEMNCERCGAIPTPLEHFAGVNSYTATTLLGGYPARLCLACRQLWAARAIEPARRLDVAEARLKAAIRSGDPGAAEVEAEKRAAMLSNAYELSQAWLREARD